MILGRRLARSEHERLPWQLALEILAALTAPVRGWTIDGELAAHLGAVPHELSQVEMVFPLSSS